MGLVSQEPSKAEQSDGLTGLKAAAFGFGRKEEALTFSLEDVTEAVGLPGVVTVVPLRVLSCAEGSFEVTLRLFGSKGGIFAILMAIGARLFPGAAPSLPVVEAVTFMAGLAAAPAGVPVACGLTAATFDAPPLKGGMA